MSEMLTLSDVADELRTSLSRLNYVLNRDGIIAASRSGRGRGGGRMFSRKQVGEIRKSLQATRMYDLRTW